MHRRLLALLVSCPLVFAQEAPAAEAPKDSPSASPASFLWSASVSQWGQAGDSSSSHQTTFSLSWSARTSTFRFTPSVRAVRSRQTSPDSSWWEVEPSAKLRASLGTAGALTLAGWATTVQAPRDAGGSARLSGSLEPWTGGDLEGWVQAQDSRETRAEGGVGARLGQELSGALSFSADAGAWYARKVFPSGQTDPSYSPEWSLGSGLSWDEDAWSVSTSGTWSWYEAEREIKSDRKLLASRAKTTERVRHDDWSVSLDAGWDPLDALGLWSSLSWRWTQESGSVELTRLSTGAKKDFTPTSLATVEDGPSWEFGATWTW